MFIMSLHFFSGVLLNLAAECCNVEYVQVEAAVTVVVVVVVVMVLVLVIVVVTLISLIAVVVTFCPDAFSITISKQSVINIITYVRTKLCTMIGLI